MRIPGRSKNSIFSSNTQVMVHLKAILPLFLVLVAAAIVACGIETPGAGPEPGVEGNPPTAVASRGAESVPQSTTPARVDRQKPPQSDTSTSNTASAADTGRAESGKGIDSVGDVQISAVVQEPVPADTAEALEALVDFIVRAKLSNLSILEIFSGGFRQELLSPDVQVDSESFEPLLAAWDRLAPIRERTLGAIDRLDQQPRALEAPSSKGLGLAAPTTGPFDAVRDAAIEFFGWVDGSGERSRSRILAIADALPEADRNQLYGEWKQFYSDQAPGVKDADDLFNRLRGGALDSMASRLHTQLLDVSATSVDSPQYANLAQDQNALLTQVAFEEGAEGVVKGAKFNVEASFAALNAQFPRISEGRGYTDKADKWLEYGQQVYEDPTGAAANLLRSQVESQISQPFGAASAGTGESVGELLAEAVSSIATQTPGFGAPSGDLVGDSGIAGLDREARTAVAIRQDWDGTGPLISVAVPDLEDPIIILPEGEYSVVSFDAKNSVASSGEIVIETGWEKPVGHPLAGIPSQELRLGEIKVQAEEGRLGPETVTIWKRVRTDVNPDNDPTEGNVAATQGRFEGSHNNWDISETSFQQMQHTMDDQMG